MSRLRLSSASSPGSHVSTTRRPSVPRTYLEFSLMVLEGTAAAPNPVELSLLLWVSEPSCLLRRLRRKKNIAAAIRATSITKPTARPTAPPVPSPPPPPLFVATRLLSLVACAFGGTVGVTKTVRIEPVTVSIDVIAVGVHVNDVAEDVERREVVVVGSSCEKLVQEVVKLSTCS